MGTRAAGRCAYGEAQGQASGAPGRVHQSRPPATGLVRHARRRCGCRASGPGLCRAHAQHGPRRGCSAPACRLVPAARRQRAAPWQYVYAAPSATGPLAAQIYNAETEIGLLSEDLLKKREEQAQARTDLAIAHRQLDEARVAVAEAEADAESAAAQAIKEAAELPPGAFGSDLHGLSELGRIQRGESSTAKSDAAEHEVARAKDAERVAQEAYNTALGKEQSLVGQFNTIEATLKTKEAALAEVKERNSAQLAVIEREREAQEAKLSEGFLNADNIAGMAADPRAIKAVNFALGELGKPYVWGTEGPNTYDCSGLMWAAYRYAGYQLPRVSRDQYAATRSRSVSTSAMLPGDLVFFSSNGTASGIHHVGMYLGEGRMVHAPNSREKVKVSTVWYSRLFAATRIYGAVPAPPDLPPTAPPTNPPSTTPPPTTNPPATTPPTTTPPTTPPPTTPGEPTTPPETPPPTTPGEPTTPPESPPPPRRRNRPRRRRRRRPTRRVPRPRSRRPSPRRPAPAKPPRPLPRPSPMCPLRPTLPPERARLADGSVRIVDGLGRRKWVVGQVAAHNPTPGVRAPGDVAR
ncbi:hypothetical protein Pflav_074000 [Phytohabitans flavus]|uniref:NlpC/P60 domain-containing protein n=1 Tax=Phytohabitans flavus TaxID=1076124 RepID=A0A6F8Y4K6_9ACTN|nr:C40 family peptidase [Phytohabitans flavus]BCB80990.1 hypothetical protein Pflav_074000 [Phytohabitans flavus]